MADFEYYPDYIPESEEVEAYPLVLEFAAINWVSRMRDNQDPGQELGIALASTYCRDLIDDTAICNGIAEASGMYGCAKSDTKNVLAYRPLHF
jgi:hypothetical protein